VTRGPIAARALLAPAAGQAPIVTSIEVDPPGPGEVRVRMLASGVCHTDAMVAEGVWWSDHPYVLGHEGVGVVEEVGEDVPAALAGRTVLLAWRAACGACRFCRRGEERLCVDLAWARGRLRTGEGRTAIPSLRLGTHATHAVVAAGQALPVPDGLSPAALCTIGCAVMTGVGAVINTAGVRAGERVAVIGCGGVGLSVIQGARLAGAARIVAIDRREDKLDAARRFGATDTALAAPGSDAADLVRSLTDGLGVDHAFECVGTGDAVLAAIRSCDVGGTAVLIGTPARDARLELDVATLFFPRLTVRASQYGDAMPARDFPRLVEWYAAGALHLDDLVSRQIELDDAPAAIADLHAGDLLRTVIRFGGQSAGTA
jgi:S-(hydroxymethyl)mycothiol dehydrogenase